MDFKLVETFLRVFEEGNVSRAASKLNIVQPAVSHQVKKLETDLKIALFERTPRGMKPTPSGRALYRLFAPVLADFHAAERQARGLRGAEVHEVSIGLNPFASDALTGEVLQAFRMHFPEVELHVNEEVSDTLLRQVTEGALDLAIVHMGDRSESVPANVVATPLASEELVFVERQSGARNAEPLRFAELAGRPLALLKSRQGFRRDLEYVAARSGISLNPVLEITAPGPLLDLVANGGLATVVPEITARRAMAHLPLHMRRLVRPSVVRTILSVHHIDRPLTPVLSKFVSIVKSAVEKQLAGTRRRQAIVPRKDAPQIWPPRKGLREAH